jgi:hypothetical protein
MASIPIDQTESILNTIIQKIVKHFELSKEEEEQLLQCYNSSPRISGEQDNLFLMKGNCGILIPPSYSDIENIPSELKSFWTAIFNVLLTHHKEPILLVGPSSFKTFLASHILKTAPILVVHSETSISQLLGSIMLVNSKRSKEFYLDQFCKIIKNTSCFSDLLSELSSFDNIEAEKLIMTSETNSHFQNEYNIELNSTNKINNLKIEKDLKSDDSVDFEFSSSEYSDTGEESSKHESQSDLDKFDEQTLSRDKEKEILPSQHIKSLHFKLSRMMEDSFADKKIPLSFRAVLDHLIDKITEILPKADDSFGLGDFTTIFKPGLFTSAVLEQAPLILKDLPNLSPAVFERFNQLNSNNPTLTLNEDISNTFTTPDTRTLNGFSEGFRIVSICSSEARKNLSEAALSRITTIFTGGYNRDEARIALKSVCNLLFQPNLTDPVNSIEKFSAKYIEFFKKTLSFPIKSKILNLFDHMNKGRSKQPEFNLGLSIYRIVCGQVKSMETKKKILEILRESDIQIPESLYSFVSTPEKISQPLIEDFHQEY